MRLIDENVLLGEIEKLPFINEKYDHEHANKSFINGIETFHVMVLNVLKRQSIIDPESLRQQWIPVTERLPDENQPVCILLENGNVFRAEIRMRELLKEWWYRYDPTDEDMDMLGIHYEVEGWLKENPIVAWMPLPEPYKGGT